MEISLEKKKKCVNDKEIIVSAECLSFIYLRR